MAKQDDFKDVTKKFFSENEEQEQPDQKDQEGEKKPRYSHRRSAEADFTPPPGYVLKQEAKSRHMQLLVTPQVFNCIDFLAKENKLSRNAMLNKIIREYLVKEGLIDE